MKDLEKTVKRNERFDQAFYGGEPEPRQHPRIPGLNKDETDDIFEWWHEHWRQGLTSFTITAAIAAFIMTTIVLNLFATLLGIIIFAVIALIGFGIAWLVIHSLIYGNP